MSFASASYIQTSAPVEIIQGKCYTIDDIASNTPEEIGTIELDTGSYIVSFNYLVFNKGSAAITEIIYSFDNVNYVGLFSDYGGTEGASLIDYSSSLANSCTFCINVPEDAIYELNVEIIYTLPPGVGTSGPSINEGPTTLGEIPQFCYLKALKIA